MVTMCASFSMLSTSCICLVPVDFLSLNLHAIWFDMVYLSFVRRNIKFG